jgi:hypothetical protein
MTLAKLKHLPENGEEVSFTPGEVRALGRVFLLDDGTWSGVVIGNSRAADSRRAAAPSNPRSPSFFRDNRSAGRRRQDSFPVLRTT